VIGHAGVVRSVAFSPDGNRVVSASEDNMVKIWDTETGAEVISLVGVHSLWRGDAGGVLAFLAGLALSVV
jgi:WD40 repeat protein